MTCCHNNYGEERGKEGQYKDRVVSFVTAKTEDMDNTREGESRRTRKELTEFVRASHLSMVFPCLPIEVGITWFAISLKLHFFAVVDFFGRTESFHSTKVGFLSISKDEKKSSQTTSCCWFLTKKEMMACHFEWVLLTTGFIVWCRKNLVFLFWDCLNVTRFHHGDLFEAYLLMLFSAYRFQPWPFYSWCSYGFLSIVHPIIFQSKCQ